MPRGIRAHLPAGKFTAGQVKDVEVILVKEIKGRPSMSLPSSTLKAEERGEKMSSGTNKKSAN
jgi:hypothetical protein